MISPHRNAPRYGFFDAEYVKRCRREYEAIRQRRKAQRGKPDVYDRIELDLDKSFEPFYRWVGSQQD